VRHIHAILSVCVWESSTYLINHPLAEIELPRVLLITEALPGLGQLPTPSGRFGGKMPRLDLNYVGIELEYRIQEVNNMKNI